MRYPVPRPRKNSGSKTSNGATVGYEAQLWQMADALRGSMDAAEYKHVVLGLIFLKYISDAFEEKMKRLTTQWREQQAEAAKLERLIKANLEEFGYGV